jgi:hypothetical protein
MKLALYTTIHPGTRPYLRDWYASVQAQTDTAPHLWVGLDGMTVDEVTEAIGARPQARWVHAKAGDRPAEVRMRAWNQLLPEVDAVVMVDADDVLDPERVARSRQAIEHADLAGCAMTLVDQQGDPLGNPLGDVMPGSDYAAPNDVMPVYNLFGLTNSTYRTELLKQLLPLPPSTTLVDWHLSTHAWLRGATLQFDPRPSMNYRQHPRSTLALTPPFTADGIRKTAQAVHDHFTSVLSPGPSLGGAAPRRARLQAAACRIEQFVRCVTSNPEKLSRYTNALNDAPPPPLWWSSVAHPDFHPFCS